MDQRRGKIGEKWSNVTVQKKDGEETDEGDGTE